MAKTINILDKSLIVFITLSLKISKVDSKLMHKKNNIKAHANANEHLNIFNYIFVR